MNIAEDVGWEGEGLFLFTRAGSGTLQGGAGPTVEGVETERSTQKKQETETVSEAGMLRMPALPADRPLLDFDTLHDLMRRALERSGLSQQEVGLRMGYPEATAKQNVNKLLRRNLTHDDEGPGIIKIATFAQAVGLSLADLLDLREDGDRASHPPGPPLTLPTLQAKLGFAMASAGAAPKEIGRRMGLTPGTESQVVYDLTRGAADRERGIFRIDSFARACGMTLSELLRQEPGQEIAHSAATDNAGVTLPSPQVETLPRAAEALARISRTAQAIDPDADFLRVRGELLALSREFRAEVLATLFEPAFIRRLKSLPSETFEQKQLLCKWVNSTLGELGLAVAAPDDGSPASLVAGTGGQPAKGRFEFVVRGAGGSQRRVRMTTLPDHLHLTAALPERKPGGTAAKSVDASERAAQIVLSVEEMQEELDKRAGKSFGSEEANRREVEIVKAWSKASGLKLVHEGHDVTINLYMAPRSKTGSFVLRTTGTQRELVYSDPLWPPLAAVRR